MPDGMMPRHARAVVVGAGIAGCSVAYHLTTLGWRDIVVVDQGPLFETGGSTSHAPGLVFQINPSKTMTSLARATVDLWSQLELGGVPCVNTVGSLEVAWTPERLADLKRKVGYGLSWGVEAHLLGGAEARGLFPLLSERVLGALYVPSDIQTPATRPAEAMAREAERNGAAFHGNVKVTGFGITDGRVAAVRTTQGDIKTDLVVSAVGIWAPRLGGLAGVSIPLSPLQHIYAVTTPLPDLAGSTEDISLPIVRHQDAAMYFRQVGEAIGIGSYRHEPLVVEADDILDHEEAPIAPAEMPFTPDHFESGMAAAREVLPSLEGAGLTRKFNGLFSFTTDGFPVLGESPAGARILVGAGRVDHPRRRRRQGGRRVDRERRADHRPSRVRHQALPPTRAQPPLCPGAGRAAVPRGVRHHSPAAADGQSPEHPPDALLTRGNANSAPCSSRTRVGNGRSGSTPTRGCSTHSPSPANRVPAGRRVNGRRQWRPSTWPPVSARPCSTSAHSRSSR